MGLHISLAAEPIAHIGSFPITNSLLMTWIAMAVLIVIAAIIKFSLSSKPKGLQNAFEYIVEYFVSLIQSVTQNRKQSYRFFPLVFTFFIFILVSNYLGLLPGVGSIGKKHEPQQTTNEESSGLQVLQGTDSFEQVGGMLTDAEERPVAIEGAEADEEHAVEGATQEETLTPIFRPPNADLNSTIAWALISVVMSQVFGIMALGFFGYGSKFFPIKGLFRKSKKSGIPTPSFQGIIHLFIGILEIISEIAKIVSFSFRLFGNVFAGEVLLVVISFLVAYVAPLPFYALELFVGLIQALVFAMLSLVFFKMATVGHEEHEEEDEVEHDRVDEPSKQTPLEQTTR